MRGSAHGPPPGGDSELACAAFRPGGVRGVPEGEGAGSPTGECGDAATRRDGRASVGPHRQVPLVSFGEPRTNLTLGPGATEIRPLKGHLRKR